METLAGSTARAATTQSRPVRWHIVRPVPSALSRSQKPSS